VNTAICLQCGSKNRLRRPPKGQLPACGKCGATLPWLVQATDESFQSELDTETLVLVDFWAAWCGPCRMIAPVLEELSRELAGKLKVVKLNVDENPKTAGAFRVQSIPMLIVFKGGEVAETFVGAMPKGAMLARLKPHL
jgi:thioredoxin 2